MQEENNLFKLKKIIDSFYSSRLILAEQEIAKLLKTLVSEPKFLEIITECVNIYNYNVEYEKAISYVGNKPSFNLPQSRRKTVSLVTGLMYQFDNGSLSIVEFIKTYYPDETTHGSYIKFIKGIITPFYDAFFMLLTTNYDIPEVKTEEVVFQLHTHAKDQCLNWLALLKDTVVSSNEISEDIREDAIELIAGFQHVLEIQESTLIKYLWLGLKNTLAPQKKCFRELQEIASILYHYGVLNSIDF